MRQLPRNKVPGTKKLCAISIFDQSAPHLTLEELNLARLVAPMGDSADRKTTTDLDHLVPELIRGAAGKSLALYAGCERAMVAERMAAEREERTVRARALAGGCAPFLGFARSAAPGLLHFIGFVAGDWEAAARSQIAPGGESDDLGSGGRAAANGRETRERLFFQMALLGQRLERESLMLGCNIEGGFSVNIFLGNGYSL